MFRSDQTAIRSSAEPTYCFIERTTGDVNESSIVGVRTPSVSFSDIRANTVGSPDKLFAHGITRKVSPHNGNRPHFSRETVGKLVDM